MRDKTVQADPEVGMNVRKETHNGKSKDVMVFSHNISSKIVYSCAYRHSIAISEIVIPQQQMQASYAHPNYNLVHHQI
jgi:hypothetical protein